MKRRTIRISLVAALLVVAILIVLPLLFLRPIAEQVASRSLGREVSIGTGPHVEWGWPVLTVGFGGVTVANAPWGEQPALMTLETVKTGVDVASSFRQVGLRVHNLTLRQPAVYLERKSDGGLNWPSSPVDTDESRTGAAPVIDSLVIEGGSLEYRDARSGANLSGSFETMEPVQAGTRLRFRGEGTYNAEALSVEALASVPLSLEVWTEEGIDVSARLESGDTTLGIDGRLTQPIQSSNLTLRLSGPNPAELYPLIPIPFPDLPPYDVSAKVELDDERWSLLDLAGTVGDSDLAGHLTVAHAGRRLIKGELRSKYLDLDDLGGLVGAAPDPSETASAEQRARARNSERRDTVFSNAPIDVRKLAVSDVDLVYRAERIKTPDLPLSRMSVHVMLEDGHLTLRDLTIGLAGGTLSGTLEVESRASDVRVSVDAAIDKVRLRDLLKAYDRDNEGAGVIRGRIVGAGEGRSIAEFMASSESQVELYMEGGRLDVVLVELAGLDLGEALLGWLSNPDTVAIRCAFVDMAGKDGVLRERSIVVDTRDTSFIGVGSIDFGAEQIQMVLIPRAKDVSFFSAESNIYIQGPLKGPRASPDPVEALVELLTPIETGTGVADADCEGLVKEMERRVQ